MGSNIGDLMYLSATIRESPVASAWFQSSKRARTSVSVISGIVGGEGAAVEKAAAGTFVIRGASMALTRSVRTPPLKLVVVERERDAAVIATGAKADE